MEKSKGFAAWLLDTGARQIGGLILLIWTVRVCWGEDHLSDYSGLLALWGALIVGMIVPKRWIPMTFMALAIFIFCFGMYAGIGSAKGAWLLIASPVCSLIFLACAKLKFDELTAPTKHLPPSG